jgi:polysaccharide export outer membrane protein
VLRKFSLETVMTRTMKFAVLTGLLGVSFLLLLPAAVGQAAVTPGDASPADAAKADKSKAAEPAASPQALPSDYVIGADDQLKISVWNETNLSETVPVRPDGKISMPLLNDVDAAGLTPTQLKDSITEKLRKFISDPRVTIVVLAMNSRRVFVTGEVNHTGPMTLLPHMTVLQALAQAGFTQFANVKNIYLLRTENGKQSRIAFNYKEVVKGRRAEENIQLKPGDTIVVP